MEKRCSATSLRSRFSSLIWSRRKKGDNAKDCRMEPILHGAKYRKQSHRQRGGNRTART